MATVTPNFNWPVPTSTDLVKDGATAIEALGDSIDASLVDLKGGTTGQVLAKATNTDMDFAWVAQDDSNAIQNSIVDAKGDLIAASANDTPARLAVGSNGETLVADSSTATGLRYQGSMAAGRNFFINGGMDVWQRGTSIALTTSAYTSDRWQGYRAVAGSTVSRQVTGDTTNLPFIQYCARVQRDSGNTATNTIYLGTSIETINSIPLAGKTVTLSFYARAGANYSSASSALIVVLGIGTGTDQNFITTGYTGNVNAINSTATLTTTWQRFTYTATLAATATEIGLQLSNIPVGTAGAADYYEVTGVQLEVGSVATQFSRTGGSIQGELAACQRYYVRFDNDAVNGIHGIGLAYDTTNTYFSNQLPVTMRTRPSALDFSALRVSDGVTATNITSASIALSDRNQPLIQFVVASGLTAFRPYLLQQQSTSGYYGLSAEL
jgi:hypothetical protein